MQLVKIHTLSGFHLENFIRGGSSVLTIKDGCDQMKKRCGFYSKLGYCEGVVEEFGGGEVRELEGEASPPPPLVDETLTIICRGVHKLNGFNRDSEVGGVQPP